jgi:hypothetical protein
MYRNTSSPLGNSKSFVLLQIVISVTPLRSTLEDQVHPNVTTVAEKTFIKLRETAAAHPEITCIAISHSDEASTNNWLQAVGGAESVRIIVDDQRELYAAWGLGVSSWWHVLSPSGLFAVYKLGKEEGIWNRPTGSGSRWQMAGSFAVDGEGTVVWGGASASADEIPYFEQAVKAIGNGKR